MNNTINAIKKSDNIQFLNKNQKITQPTNEEIIRKVEEERNKLFPHSEEVIIKSEHIPFTIRNASNEVKSYVNYQHNIISNQSNQMMSMIDIINQYSKDFDNLRKDNENKKSMIVNLKKSFNVQTGLTLIFGILIILFINYINRKL